MPQTAPLSWLSLFMIFLLTFMMFNILNSYSFIPSTPKSSSIKNINKNSMNWKW